MTQLRSLPELVTDTNGAAFPEVVWIDSGALRLGFVPAIGGRLLSVRLGETETLWRNPALLDDALRPVGGHVPAPVSGQLGDWDNYGGDKTWPAPQGWSGPAEWAGPPDPVLDSGAYDWRAEHVGESLTLTMTSADDPRTGLRLTRALTVRAGESAYDLELTATNVSDQPVTWALWNVTQRRADEDGTGGVYVGVEPGRTDAVALVAGTGTPSVRACDPSRVLVPHQEVVGKVGFPGALGWLAHVAGGTITTQTYDVAADAEYPDGGSRVEVWMEHPLPRPLDQLGGLFPPARIVEIEVLGPLSRLEPGQAMRQHLRCGTAVGTAPVVAVSSAGHWEWGPTLDGGRLRGRFGAYVSGELTPAGSLERLVTVRAGSVVDIDARATEPALSYEHLALRVPDTDRVLDAGTVTDKGVGV